MRIYNLPFLILQRKRVKIKEERLFIAIVENSSSNTREFSGTDERPKSSDSVNTIKPRPNTKIKKKFILKYIVLFECMLCLHCCYLKPQSK